MCISDVGLYTKIKLWSKQCIMPKVLRMGLLILIIVFIVVARELIHKSYEEISIPSVSNEIDILENTELSKEESTTLFILYSVFKLSINIGRIDNSIYYWTLKEYFSKPGINLSKKSAEEMISKLKELQEIILYEGEAEVTNMSLEGKNAADCLLKQIYELCGLDMEKKPQAKPQLLLHTNVLIIILLLLLSLFLISIIIAKKNQLFGKEVIYDGIDEERFA